MRLLYLYGEEITGKRAREIHTLNRVRSLAKAGVEVTLVTASRERGITAESFLKSMGLEEKERIHFQMFSREWKIGSLSVKSSPYFYRQVGAWMENQAPFDVVYGIHLKAAAFIKKRFSRLPMIFEAHEVFSDAFDCRSWRYRKLCIDEQAVYKKVDGVV
ncbi:MAG: glycosyltransferase, partial [Verrucomicrobiota bacterium]